MPNDRKPAQKAALAAGVAAIDAGKAPRVLAALEGPYAPLRAKREPYWRPPLPRMLDRLHLPAGIMWSRDNYAGPVVTLDRTGAWVAAGSSVEVAHGELQNTGRRGFEGRPGYYLTDCWPWYETTMPDPLAGARAERRPPSTRIDEVPAVWVPHPTMRLLADLADAGRRPYPSVLDSWTSDAPCRLREWTTYVNELRGWAISVHGRDSDHYDRVKTAYAQAVSMMLGKIGDNGRREWACKAARPDWRHAIQAQTVAMQWRWADDLRQVAGDELAPVALRHVDEIVLPAEALPIVTRTERPGGRKPLMIDHLGILLGSFKVKEEGSWPA